MEQEINVAKVKRTIGDYVAVLETAEWLHLRKTQMVVLLSRRSSNSVSPSYSVSHQLQNPLRGRRLRQINENMTETTWAKTATKKQKPKHKRFPCYHSPQRRWVWRWVLPGSEQGGSSGSCIIWARCSQRGHMPRPRGVVGGWAAELWSCGQLLGPSWRTIWRWIMCVFCKKLWTPIARFSGMLTRIDHLPEISCCTAIKARKMKSNWN